MATLNTDRRAQREQGHLLGENYAIQARGYGVFARTGEVEAVRTGWMQI